LQETKSQIFFWQRPATMDGKAQTQEANEYTALHQRVQELEDMVVALQNKLAVYENQPSTQTKRNNPASTPGTANIPYQAIFEHLPAPLVLFQADGQIAATNQCAEAFTQTSRKSTIGNMNIFDERETCTRRHVEHFKRALQGEIIRIPPADSQELATDGLQERNKDQMHWAETTYFPIQDNHGHIRYVGQLSLDITDRKQTEHAYRLLIEHSLQGLIIFQGCRIVFANHTASEITGYSCAELTSMSCHQMIERIVPEDQKPFLDYARNTSTAQGNPLRYELRIFHKQGAIRTLDISATHTVYHGKPAVQMAYIDVTERKKMEEALQQECEELEQRVQERTAELSRTNEALRISEERHRIVSELITDYVYAGHRTQDDQLVTEWITGAFHRITGYTLEEIAAMGGWTSILYPEDLPIAEKVSRSILASRSCVVEYRIIHRRGDIRWLRDHIRPLPEQAGPYKTRIIGAVQDITSYKQHEEELQAARDAAESANRAKSEFLANMGHEIRTPLNAIIGMTSMLFDSNLTPQEQEFVDIIRSSGNALLIILNDILDFARLDTGKLKLECYPFNLRACIEETLDFFAPQARERNLELSYVIHDQTPAEIISDRSRIQHILMNLLSNALKFTEQGEIVVQVEQNEPASQLAAWQREKQRMGAPYAKAPFRLHISVRDTGIGIPQEKFPSLFQTFCQLDGSITRKYNGMGLGLALSKRLANLMGGFLWGESEPGQGSTFHVVLTVGTTSRQAEQPLLFMQPAPDPPGSALSSLPNKTISPLHLLLIEDNTVNQRILLRFLYHLNYRADVVANKLEALDMLERQSYHVIFTSLSQNETEGLDIIKHIRSLSRLAEQPRIIAILPYGSANQGNTLLAQGIDDYLIKPVRVEELANVLRNEISKEYHIPRDTPTLDREVFQDFQRMIGANNTQVVQELVDIFLNDIQEKLTSVQQAIVQKDTETISKVSLSLKLSSSQIGARSLAMLFEQIEKLAQHPCSSSHSNQQLEQLCKQTWTIYEQLKETLHQTIGQ
jgi:PAS domain S-box-containing protein